MTITKEQILTVEKNLIEAIKSNDVDTLNNLLHDDLLFMIPNGDTITKKIDLEAYKSGAMIIENIIPTIETINFIDDTAIVTVVIDIKGKMLEQNIEGKFRYIRFWKLFKNEPKVIGGSCIQI